MGPLVQLGECLLRMQEVASSNLAWSISFLRHGQVGKASVFGTDMRRFESCCRNQTPERASINKSVYGLTKNQLVRTLSLAVSSIRKNSQSIMPKLR